MRIAVFLILLLALAFQAEQTHAVEFEPPRPLSEAAQGTALTDIEGNPVSLTDYRDQVVVINFWATWCGPCRREMPSIGRLQAAFDGRALIVLAIAVDRASPEKLRTFMEETEASHVLVLRDTAMASMKGFELRGLPATIVLNPEGFQVARHDGYEEWDRPDILEALEQLLPGA